MIPPPAYTPTSPTALLLVFQVIGLDIADANVEAARANAAMSGHSKAIFVRGDSFRPLESFMFAKTPFTADDPSATLHGMDVVLANPPASSGDDGFGFRRRILREVRDVLKPGGLLVMQWLSYYGPERIAQALEHAPGMRYRGVVGSSEWVRLGTDRRRETGSTAEGTLLQQLQDYAEEEERGGLRYYCTPVDPEALSGSESSPAVAAAGAAAAASAGGDRRIEIYPDPAGRGEGPVFTVLSHLLVETCTAVETLARARAGHEPLCRWQCHLFERDDSGA